MPTVAIKSSNRDAVEAALRHHAAELRRQHPEVERILWFGSRVSGVPTPGSDVDLCVILADSDKPFRDRIPGLLPFGFPVGIDLFPYTRAEFQRLQETDPAWHGVLTAGVDL